MSTALSVKDTATQVRSAIARPETYGDIVAALQDWANPQQFLSAFYVEMLKPKNIICTVASIASCCKTMAVLQLMPGTQAVIVPRKGTATTMIQWQGLKALMERANPSTRGLKAVLVHRLDTIEVDGLTDTVIRHDKQHFNPQRVFKSLDDVVGGYLEIPGHPKRYHIVHRDVFVKARRCAQSDDIWSSWLEEMLLKTVFRNAYARQVVTIDMHYRRLVDDAFKHEDEVLGNDPSRLSQPTRDSRDLMSIAKPADPRKPAALPEPEDEPEAIDVTSEPIESEDSSERQPEASRSTPDRDTPPTASWEEVVQTFAVASNERQLTLLHARLRKEMSKDRHPQLAKLYTQALHNLAPASGAAAEELFSKGSPSAE